VLVDGRTLAMGANSPVAIAKLLRPATEVLARATRDPASLAGQLACRRRR